MSVLYGRRIQRVATVFVGFLVVTACSPTETQADDGLTHSSQEAVAGLSDVEVAVATSAPARTVRIALHDWSSQNVGANVLAEVLRAAGHESVLVESGSVDVYDSLCAGDVDVVHEVWETAFGRSFEPLEKRGCVEALTTYDIRTHEGWWYPTYVGELCPGLPDWTALNSCAHLFDSESSGGQGVFVSGPADWGSAKPHPSVLGLEYVVEHAVHEQDLHDRIAESVANREPILAMAWSPYFTEALYDGRFVEFPASTDACHSDAEWGPNPELTGDCDRPYGDMKLAASAVFIEDFPEAAMILSRVDFTSADLAGFAADVDIHDLTAGVAAQRWLDANTVRWRAWLRL